MTSPNLQRAIGLTNFRNKIINGGFDIWQRGVTWTAGTGFRYLADRFFTSSTGTTHAVSQQAFALGQTDVPGEPQFFQRVTVVSSTGAANHAFTGTTVEDVRTLAGRTVTVSFWAKAEAAKTVAVEMGQRFGAGGSAGVDIAPQTITLTTAWQRFTLQFAIPSVAGKTIGTPANYLQLVLWMDAGTSFASRAGGIGHQNITLDLAQVQLEEGPIATPFEQRPIGLELSLCQRYYTVARDLLVTGPNVVTGGTHYATFSLPQRMRVIPTCTLTQAREDGGSTSNLMGSPVLNGASVDLVRVSATSTTSTSGTNIFLFARVTADAEL
jgi:hypothetical protein